MVFGLFSKERALERAIKKTTNKLAPTEERWAAMEKLRDDGSEEALLGLLRRFSFASLKSVEDEQEKAWVVESMIAMGERCLPALRRYMKSATSIAYPLRILAGVAGPAMVLQVIDELLADEQPGYTRDPSKRIQIIDWLSEWKGATNADVVQRVVPYLKDFDEGVRFAAAEALSHHATADAAEPLITAMLSPDEESRRLKVRIAEILADRELDLREQKKAVAALFDDLLTDFRMQNDKLVRK